MTGQGSLRAQLSCLRGTSMSNGATSCADLGAFSELPFDLAGRYRDPTAPSA